MRGESSVIGAYIFILIFIAALTGLSIAADRVSRGVASQFDKYYGMFYQLANQPLLTLAIRNGTLYLLVLPSAPTQLEALVIRYSNGSYAYRPLGLWANETSPTAIELANLSAYDGTPFQPVLVLGDGVAMAYVPSKDPAISWINNVYGYKTYVDWDVIRALAGGQGSAPLQAFNIVQMPGNGDAVVSVVRAPPYSLATFEGNVTLTLRVWLYYNRSNLYLASYTFYAGGSYSFPASASVSILDTSLGVGVPQLYWGAGIPLNLGGVEVEAKPFVLSYYRGYVDFWIQSQGRFLHLVRPVAPVYVGIAFSSSAVVGLAGNVSVLATISGGRYEYFYFYFPASSPDSAVLSDYYGPLLFTALCYAPIAQASGGGNFSGLVSQGNIYVAFNNTAQYGATNGTYLTPLGAYLSRSSCSGSFATSSFVLLAAGNLLAAGPAPSSLPSDAPMYLEANVTITRAEAALADFHVPITLYPTARMTSSGDLNETTYYELNATAGNFLRVDRSWPSWKSPLAILVDQRKVDILVPVGNLNASAELQVGAPAQLAAPKGRIYVLDGQLGVPAACDWTLHVQGPPISTSSGSTISVTWEASASWSAAGLFLPYVEVAGNRYIALALVGGGTSFSQGDVAGEGYVVAYSSLPLNITSSYSFRTTAYFYRLDGGPSPPLVLANRTPYTSLELGPGSTASVALGRGTYLVLVMPSDPYLHPCPCFYRAYILVLL
ncbi:MAG: hypothetical protein ABWK00_04570 [Desulfurococcaceae archaeon]